MDVHTFTKEQLVVLADALDAVIKHGIFDKELKEEKEWDRPSRNLLGKLRRAKPSPGMEYAEIYISDEEENILENLVEGVWR